MFAARDKNDLVNQLLFNLETAMTASTPTFGVPLFSVTVQVGMLDQDHVVDVIYETMEDCGYDFNTIKFDKGYAHRGTQATVVGVSRKGAIAPELAPMLVKLLQTADELHNPPPVETEVDDLLAKAA